MMPIYNHSEFFAFNLLRTRRCVFESEFLTGTAASKEAFRQLVQRALDSVCSSLPQQPYTGKRSTELAELIDAEVLPQTGSSAPAADKLSAIVSNSIVVSHPHTVAHLHSPPLLVALTAEVVISALNQSMDSFDQAPMATVLEQKLIRWLCHEVGLSDLSGGIFTTGGTQSNYMGLLLARHALLQSRWNWSAQKGGLPPEARRLRILCSELAHFTVEKSAAQLGLGTDAVVRVAVDDRFRMTVSALEASLRVFRAAELLPLAIVATAGTTDFGSLDPLSEIASVAHEAGAWLHVDAAYGGALLFSKLHHDKLRGIAQADSLGIDFHKLLWQPIPCSAFLLREGRHFDLMKLHADYLNPEFHEQQGIPDLVTTSLLTSRRFDALKLWISLQTVGRDKLSAMIERTMDLAKCAASTIRNTPRLRLLHEPELSTVVFRYVPSRAGCNADDLNAAVRQRLFDRGIAVIGGTRVQGRQCLKFTCMNPTVTDDQMENLVRSVAQQGEELEQEFPT